MILKEFRHFFLIPILIGIVGGFSAWIFRLLIKLFTQLYNFLDTFHSIYFYLFTMPILFLVSQILISKFLKNHTNVTIDEIAKKISLLSGKFSFIKGFLVLFLTSVNIGFGLPIGREGPIAKLGGLISELFLIMLKVERVNLPIYLSAGVSAAISATFNAPIAGIIFGIEIIIGQINSYIIIPLVVACATSTMIAQEFIGDYTAFYVPHLHYDNHYFFYIPIAGLFFALLAFILTKTLKQFRKMRFKYRKHWRYVVTILGLLVGLFIVTVPEIRGVGYEYINQIFSSGYHSHTALNIMLFKIFAVILTIGSGIFGGLMSPSIFIGAFGGYWFGSELLQMQAQIDPRVFALIGSGAMLAGISRAPLRSSVIITELTHSYQLLLPILFTSAITAYFLTKTELGSYFKRSLLQKGIDIEDPSVSNFLKNCNLTKYIDNIPPLKPTDNLKKSLKLFRVSHSNYLPIIDEKSYLVGILSLRDVRKSRLINMHKKITKIKIDDLMSRQPFSIKEYFTLTDLYKAISILNANHIPYTDQNGKYIGMLNIHKLLKDLTLYQQGYKIRNYID